MVSSGRSRGCCARSLPTSGRSPKPLAHCDATGLKGATTYAKHWASGHEAARRDIRRKVARYMHDSELRCTARRCVLGDAALTCRLELPPTIKPYLVAVRSLREHPLTPPRLTLTPALGGRTNRLAPRQEAGTRLMPEPAFESVGRQQSQVPRVQAYASAMIRPNRTPVARGTASSAASCPRSTVEGHMEPRPLPGPAIRRSTTSRASR